jgi:hypothetical protein
MRCERPAQNGDQPLKAEGPGLSVGGVRICVASALSMLIVGEEIVEMVKSRGTTPIMFDPSMHAPRTVCSNDSYAVQGQLKVVIGLLKTEGPGSSVVCLCMASALSMLIVDEEIMEMVKTRGEAPMMFNHSIAIVKAALQCLEPNAASPPDDAALTVSMAEAMAQAMWGAAYYCTLPGGGGVEAAHVVSLGEMGAATWANDKYPLGKVAHCIAATLASLASNPECAAVLMAPGAAAGAVKTLMLLVLVYDHGVFTHSGHVRAAAACAISFLACHNMNATGDACLSGPYRVALLEQGALVWQSSLYSFVHLAVLQPFRTALLSCSRERHPGRHRRKKAAYCSPHSLIASGQHSWDALKLLCLRASCFCRIPADMGLLGASILLRDKILSCVG